MEACPFGIVSMNDLDDFWDRSIHGTFGLMAVVVAKPVESLDPGSWFGRLLRLRGPVSGKWETNGHEFDCGR